MIGGIRVELPEPLLNQRPYEAFKARMAFLNPTMYWSDTKQALCPKNTSSALPDLPALPAADCSIALTYYPSTYIYTRKGLTCLQSISWPSLRTSVILHGIFEEAELKPEHQNPGRITTPFTEEYLEALTIIAPDFVEKSGCLDGAGNKAKKEISRHLKHLKFLTAETYWDFAIRVYNQYCMEGIIRHIFVKGRKHFVPGGHVPPGWWGIRATLLMRLAHDYPPIQTKGVRLAFKFYRRRMGWFMREILVPVTKDGHAAMPRGNIIILEASDKRKMVDYPFDELILMKMEKEG